MDSHIVAGNRIRYALIARRGPQPLEYLCGKGPFCRVEQIEFFYRLADLIEIIGLPGKPSHSLDHVYGIGPGFTAGESKLPMMHVSHQISDTSRRWLSLSPSI